MIFTSRRHDKDRYVTSIDLLLYLWLIVVYLYSIPFITTVSSIPLKCVKLHME